MTSRTILSAILPLAALAVLSCSKTQDTAPERRVFGDPPTIKGVVTEGFFVPRQAISCDFTDVIVKGICSLSGGLYQGLQAQSGAGWTINVGPGDNPTTAPGVFIEGTYGEAIFKVTATDPNSTKTLNDLLLVSASYVHPDETKTVPPPKVTAPPVETTLVLFDDGQINKFKNPQANGNPPGEDCEIRTDGSCICASAKYDVTSGDGTAKDDVWMRKIALHDPSANPFLLDCIMIKEHETLIKALHGSTLQFKIEAVDRSGNLTTWPNKLVAVTDSQINSFSCNGDSCGCCFMQSNEPTRECHGLPGMISPDVPDGLCIDAF